MGEEPLIQSDQLEADRQSVRRFIAGWMGHMVNRTEGVMEVIPDYHEADRFIMALYQFGHEVTPRWLRQWYMEHTCDG
jgi:hypothetical protein